MRRRNVSLGKSGAAIAQESSQMLSGKRNKKWMRRSIKINHFDKVKGRQKKVRCSSHSLSLSLLLPLIYVMFLRFFFVVCTAIRLRWTSSKPCWLKEKLLPKCNLNLRCYPSNVPERNSKAKSLVTLFADLIVICWLGRCISCVYDDENDVLTRNDFCQSLWIYAERCALNALSVIIISWISSFR